MSGRAVSGYTVAFDWQRPSKANRLRLPECMWVYIEKVTNEFHVGFFSPDGKWYSIKTFTHEGDAQREVHYLNGGEL